MNNLGAFYAVQKNDFKTAKKYWKMATKNLESNEFNFDGSYPAGGPAVENLVNYYEAYRKTEKAKKYRNMMEEIKDVYFDNELCEQKTKADEYETKILQAEPYHQRCKIS